jgi:arginyl-tRNA synthetase
MTLAELDQIECDLKRVEAKFPGDYSTAKAMELANALRQLITTTATQMQKAIPKAKRKGSLDKTQRVAACPSPK